MDKIFPAPGTEDSGESPLVLKQILATLAKKAGGEIRLKDSEIEIRSLLAVYRDPATRETVIRFDAVPWPHRED